MPQIQVYNSDPNPQPSGLEHVLTGFAKKQKQNRVEEADQDILKDIYGEFQKQNQDYGVGLQKAMSEPGLSPTARVNAVNYYKSGLESMQKNKSEILQREYDQKKLEQTQAHELKKQEQKAMYDQGKEFAGEAQKRAEVKAIVGTLKNLTPEQKEEAEKNWSPETARGFAAKEQSADIAKQKEADKQAIKTDKEKAANAITQKAFDRLGSLVKKDNVGLGSGVQGTVFGGETAKDVAEFKSLTGALESHLVEMVNRGTLSNTRFKYITETLLPQPTDRQAEIRGKLEGLALILDLDPWVLTGKPKRSNEPKSLQDIWK